MSSPASALAPAVGFVSAPPPHHAWVYLASQSPRRLQLLAQWGVASVALLPDADEDAEALEAVRPKEAARAYVQRVTRLKARAALARAARRGVAPGLIVCADTTVALGREILGKPSDAAHAAAMLQALSGQTHQVMTAVAVVRWDGVDAGAEVPVQLALSTSTVEMRRLRTEEVACYVASGEPVGKAGAYAIQGAAALWVSRLSGSYTGIMGLPAYETGQVLAAAGLDVWQALAGHAAHEAPAPSKTTPHP